MYKGEGEMPTVLFAISLIVGIVGLLFVSEVTMGVAIIAWACLIAIWARLAQAESQHEALLKRMDGGNPNNRVAS